MKLLLLGLLTSLLLASDPTWSIAPDGTYTPGPESELLPDGTYQGSEDYSVPDDISDNDIVEYQPEG